MIEGIENTETTCIDFWQIYSILLLTQVISLGLAEYRSPTPMITAAFVVDHLGADLPSFLSREGVRHRWSRYVSVVTVLSTWDFLDSMGKSMSLAFAVILHKHKASEESNSKKGKHGFNLKPNLVHFPPSTAAAFTTGAPDVVWRNAWSYRWPKPWGADDLSQCHLQLVGQHLGMSENVGLIFPMK